MLFVVLQVSASIDAVTTAPLASWAFAWKPAGLGGLLARAVADGLIGLLGIVVPYMVPLMLLLVALEQAGIMQRIAVVVDRAFHRIGLHGAAAVTLLTGFGCNVPAIANTARVLEGRERAEASFLATLVPCSARTAIILAVAGKYLGTAGIVAIFAAAFVVVALVGRFMARGTRLDTRRAHPVPPYRWPRPREVVLEAWLRSRDVVTLVLPLLVLGSVVLALLSYAGADRFINAALSPITAWTLGLPLALGVPLLFGVLRKELSLVMIHQALGTADIGAVLDATQLVVLLLFITFYVPCLSTFAVMARTLGTRAALRSAGLSAALALATGVAARGLMSLAPL